MSSRRSEPDDRGFYGLLLPFDRTSEDFSHGFECGRLWAILSESDEEWDGEVHAANAEMILRLAEATERTVRTAEIGDGWLTAYFSERSEIPEPWEPPGDGVPL